MNRKNCPTCLGTGSAACRFCLGLDVEDGILGQASAGDNCAVCDGTGMADCHDCYGTGMYLQLRRAA